MPSTYVEHGLSSKHQAFAGALTKELAKPTRTLAPTAIRGLLARGAAELAQESGLAGKTFLWLEYDQWINLAITLLVVLAGYLVGTGLIRWVLPRLVKKTQTAFDDRMLQVSGNALRWLIVVLTLRFATDRLEILQAGVKTFLADVYFFLALFLITWILWRLISLAADQARDHTMKSGDQEHFASLIRLSVGFLRLIVIISGSAIQVSYPHDHGRQAKHSQHDDQ